MSSNRSRRARVGFVLAVAGLGLASEVGAADVFVGPPPFNPNAGQTVTLQLVVDVGTDALGSYFFRFQYNPAVVVVSSVQGGTTAEFSGAPTTDASTFVSGSTPIAAAQGSLTSPQGFVSVARVTLQAAGVPGQSSNLDTAVDGLFNTQFDQLPATVFPSSVLINVPEIAVGSGFTFSNKQTLIWGASAAVTSYNVYRGTFGGVPFSFNQTCLVSGLASPGATDTQNPPLGRGFYYLVSGVRNSVEGTLGKGTGGAPRPNASPCAGSLLQVTESEFGSVALPEVAEIRRRVRIAASASLGDVERDGFIDDLDAQRVLEWVVGARSLTAAQRADADVDGDGDVDVADAQRIKQYVAGSISALRFLSVNSPASTHRVRFSNPRGNER